MNPEIEERVSVLAAQVVLNRKAAARLTDESDKKKAEITALLLESGEEKWCDGHYGVAVMSRERKTLDKFALVGLGVGTDLIERATKTTRWVETRVVEKGEGVGGEIEG
jgi:hypothetical protein